MSEEYLREFFALCRAGLNINLGKFCDKHNIYRSDFTNFMKGNKYYTSLIELDIMKEDILFNCSKFTELYKKIG